MNEKSLTVLEQYDIEIKNTYRIRGNYGCNTNKGKFILQEYNNSNEKMETMKILYDHLEKNGFLTDFVIANKEGKYVTISEDGYSYILKRWFDGSECNINEESHICILSEKLGEFHKCCQNTTMLWMEGRGFHPGINMMDAFERHNREIIQIRNYIKKRKNKNYFERSLQGIIDTYYNQGVVALDELRKSNYKEKYAKAIADKSLNHGSYNYHNVMFVDKNNRLDMVMVNMLKINYAPQIQDLYGLLRKIMEKNSWNPELGKRILFSYNEGQKISEENRHIMKAMFMYPEKFWKIINYYYNSNKAWYSEKNEEKLEQFQKLEQYRWDFIKKL